MCARARVRAWDLKEAGREANQTAQQADAQGKAGATQWRFAPVHPPPAPQYPLTWTQELVEGQPTINI